MQLYKGDVLVLAMFSFTCEPEWPWVRRPNNDFNGGRNFAGNHRSAVPVLLAISIYKQNRKCKGSVFREQFVDLRSQTPRAQFPKPR